MMMTVLYMAGGGAAGVAALALLTIRVKARLELSLAKHRSLTGHARMARRIAALIPFYDFDEAGLFRCDDAPDEIAAQRHDAFERLSQLWGQQFGQTIAVTREAAAGVSDLRFTAAYRVPFQFSRVVRQHLPSGSFLAKSSGVTVTDLDGNVFYDLTGSYGSICSVTTSIRIASTAARNACAISVRCLARIIPWWPTTSRDCERFPDWMRCRFICRAPRR